MTLVRWNPVRELASMEIDRLNHMFEDFYGNGRGWAPAVDIYETNEREFVIKAELPERPFEEELVVVVRPADVEAQLVQRSGRRPPARPFVRHLTDIRPAEGPGRKQGGANG